MAPVCIAKTVIKTKDKLLVPDALADVDWKNNPDVKLNMVSYLGFPYSIAGQENRLGLFVFWITKPKRIFKNN